MDAEIAILRLLHIVPGVIWVGSALFLAWVLQPALKKTGPPHAGALMANMVGPMTKLLHTSAVLTIVFGVLMAFRVRDPLFDYLWSTGWGTMIWLGFLLAVVGYGVGTYGGLTGKKMMAIGKSLQSPPSAEQAVEMGALQNRGMLLAKIASILVTVAVVCMALANHI
ncbi:MAG: hypothetical protein HQ477_00695 [Chloroflexi bacterium]|nr:hypothetical protein [Chloroflexota bacterium]